ncbi:MAG: transposase, partial [Rickettsia endosymbiont of Gnoriste bilineata]|nr:transposase [Rickettsia endosymbiont of Gnoriste bilineata]
LSQSDPSEIFGKEGIFQEIKKQIVNKILEKEMESHIGYEKHSKNEKVRWSPLSRQRGPP